MKSLWETLPAQPHYYLLCDGKRYARHGKNETNGLLVFTNLERAEQFKMTTGAALPVFKPVKVAAEQLYPIVMANGGRVCILNGPLSVTVATIVESGG